MAGRGKIPRHANYFILFLTESTERGNSAWNSVHRYVRRKTLWEIFIVVNLKWGTKRLCLGCGKRFYDMRRDPIVCPACDASFEVSAPARTRRQRVPVDPAKVAAPLEACAETEDGAAAKLEDPDVLVATDDVDIDVDVEEEPAQEIENSAELGKDDDDMAEVIEGIEEPEKVDV